MTLACTGVNGAVVTAAAADVTGLETVVGVVGDFDVVSDFEVLETEGDDLSFFSSIRKKIINKNHLISPKSLKNYWSQPSKIK